jgi:hypothetical protein
LLRRVLKNSSYGENLFREGGRERGKERKRENKRVSLLPAGRPLQWLISIPSEE